MYSDLINSLHFLRARTARFRRVALHLHSPDSYDWAQRPHACQIRNDRSRFSGDSGLHTFATELRSHLDFAAVTDHMRCDFANRLSQSIGPATDFGLLPGMEVNIRLNPPLDFARIHVLAILPENSSNEAFSRLFHGQPHIPDDKSRTGQEEVRDLHLHEWVNRVHAENGICIAAHVENNQGVRCLFRQSAADMLEFFCPGQGTAAERTNRVPESFRQYLVTSGIDAIEVHKPAHQQHYRLISTVNGTPHSLATTLIFDAHCVEEFERPKSVTHIKMTNLGIRGLKDAFAFPDTRIRFAETVPNGPLPRLLGVQIAGDSSTFFENVTVALAENLNCIIGVRGSGKSTIVEALRYTFGFNRTLDEISKLKDGILSLQRANLRGSLIRVAYRTMNGEDRILSATYDPKSEYDTKVYTIDGDFQNVADVEACGDFPLRLFGWSEIESLGREATRQRDLLDRLVKDLKPLLLSVAQKRSN